MLKDSSTGGWSWLRGTVFGWLHRNPKSNRVLVAAAELSPTERVLDVGCGAGAALLDASRVVTGGMLAGVDPTPTLAGTARQRLPEATIEVAEAADLPFPDDAFTLAWSISSLHHWPAHEPGLAEIARVLRPGGRLLVGERLLKDGGEGHGYDRRGIEELVETLERLDYTGVDWRAHPVRWWKLAVIIAHRPE